MSWVEALKDHIVANTSHEFGDDLFIGIMDDGDDVTEPTFAISPYGSNPIIETGAPGTAIRTPSLQVAARGEYSAAYNGVEAIHDLLELIVNETIEGVYFLRVKPKGDIQYMKTDAKDRHLFTANFDVDF